ncbi:MAG TPA: hypothetical protein VGN57_12590 [Pirellulaceae bacterium]|jgi:hypothetical protein|nr:hypothetical protein [Pirellulaceae bacterium]
MIRSPSTRATTANAAPSGGAAAEVRAATIASETECSRRRFLATGLALLSLVPGTTSCTLFRETTSDKKTELPAAPVSPDSATLEIAFVRIRPEEEANWNAQWRAMDEQIVDYDTRAALQANGFRVGLAGQQLPPFLRTLLERQKADVAEQLQGDAADQSGVRLNQAGEGRRREIVTTPVRDEIVVLTQESGSLKGDSYPTAQCVFEAKTYVEPDGRTRLELLPEVHYGELRTQYVGHNGSYLMEPRRERVPFRLLRTEVILSPGQTLVVSATPEPIGLGKNFFVQPPEEGDMRKILLIRLAISPKDPLFQESEKGEPVETPSKK